MPTIVTSGSWFEGVRMDADSRMRPRLSLLRNVSMSEIGVEGGGLATRVATAIERERDRLQSALMRHGVLRFRRVLIGDPPNDLTAIATAFSGSKPVDYVGGDSPRSRIGGHVFTSTEMPPDVPIALHHELSYSTRYPRFLFFYCVSAATRGGGSTLADGAAVLNAMEPLVRDRFVRLGVRYRYKYPAPSRLITLANKVAKVNKTWADIFETDDRAEAEARARAIGFDTAWDGDRLVALANFPSTIVHPEIGIPVWFNQAHLFQLSPRAIGRWRHFQSQIASLHPDFDTRSATFGDGSTISRAMLDAVFDALDSQTVEVDLVPGDLLVIDNRRVMHGRRPFVGPRRLLVAMTN